MVQLAHTGRKRGFWKELEGLLGRELGWKD